MLNYLTIALISHASKVMLKILQARLQQYMNHKHPHVQAGFRKGRGTRDQISNINWIIEKAIESQKNIYFCFVEYDKAFDCVDHNKLWKILQEMGISDHLTSFLRNLYAGQEATVRTGHGTTDWYQIGKGVHQGHIVSPCLLMYMQSTCTLQSTSCKMLGWMKHKMESRLPGEISITSDMQIIHTLLAESEEEVKSLLMKVKEQSEKIGLKLGIQRMKIMASCPISLMANRWGNNGNNERLYFEGLQKSLQMVTAAMKLKDACSLEEKL